MLWQRRKLRGERASDAYEIPPRLKYTATAQERAHYTIYCSERGKLCFTQPTRHKILEPSVEIAYCTEAHSPLGSSDGITTTERILHAHRDRASHRSPCINIVG